MDYYIETSLELHLFFGRIMKEHALFLEVGYTQANNNYSDEAKKFKHAFEKLLLDVIECSFGIVGREIFDAGEVITEFTYDAEKMTCKLTGTDIDQNITKLEEQLWNSCMDKRIQPGCELEKEIRSINQRAIKLLDAFICFKQQTLENVLKCKMFTMNYPLLLEHIIREAKLYLRYISNLEADCGSEPDNLKEVELFWNQIMMEHALFIRGLLDPTENNLIMTADEFANIYAQLLEEAKNMTTRTIRSVTNKTLQETMKYRDFKKAGTEGITDCKIRSLILPLLADHVLREANHYIRLLENK